MKKLLTLAVLSATMTVGAHATIILTFDDAYYVGQIIDGSPASASDEVGYINEMILLAAGTSNADYDRTGSLLNGLPSAIETGAFRDDDGGAESIDVPGTFDYILGKYGNQSYVWYNSDWGMDVQIPVAELQEDGGQGLSHSSGYNSRGQRVPDGGVSAILLGMSLLSLGLLKKLRK